MVVLLPNRADFCVALFAVLRAGGIAVPAAVQSPERELRRLLADSGAKFLVGELAETPDELTVLAAPDLDATADIELPAPTRGGEDIAVLCYTSGTAGVPRGVMLSHRALLSNVEQCAAAQAGAR